MRFPLNSTPAPYAVPPPTNLAAPKYNPLAMMNPIGDNSAPAPNMSAQAAAMAKIQEQLNQVNKETQNMVGQMGRNIRY